MSGQFTFLSFVDVCTELNSEDATKRRRAIHLFGQLLTDARLTPDAETASVFFEFFSKRLSDFGSTEEALSVMVSLDHVYHDSLRVVLHGFSDA